MAEILDIDPPAEDSNEQLVQKQSLNNDPTLTRAGTDAVLLNSLSFLDDGLRSFKLNADLSEIQFLADLLFSHGQETTANKKKVRDSRRCLIADVARERVMKPNKLSAKPKKPPPLSVNISRTLASHKTLARRTQGEIIRFTGGILPGELLRRGAHKAHNSGRCRHSLRSSCASREPLPKRRLGWTTARTGLQF